MRNMSLHSHKHSKKGTTLVELVVAMTLTAIFAVACIALIHPIESIYQRTEKTVRAQLLADTVVDSIRKECDDVQYDEEYSVWIASGTFDVSSEDDNKLFTKGVDLNTGDPGQILVIKRNNNYCEAIYSCLNISDENVQAVKDNAKTGTTTGHAVSRFETDPENRKAGIVHYGYYQAKDSGKGLYPFAAYDYTNPVTASTYGDYSVMLEFSNLTYRNDNTKKAKYPAFVECTVDVYDGDIRESGVISKGPIYSRKTAICFSANGSAQGTGSDIGGQPVNKKRDIKVVVDWVDDSNANNTRPTSAIKYVLYDNYDHILGTYELSDFTKDQNTFAFANIDTSNGVKIAVEPDPVNDNYLSADISSTSYGFSITHVINETPNIRLINGTDFRSLINKKGNINSVIFEAETDANLSHVSSSSFIDYVSIDINGNKTEDYKLYIVTKDGKRTAYIHSKTGTFIANEDCSNMFANCVSLTSITWTDSNNHFVIDTSETTNMNSMFLNCKSMKQFNVPNLVQASCLDTANMFSGCTGAEECNSLTTWNTSGVTDMSLMFYNFGSSLSNDKSLQINISGFDFQSCTSLNQMFSGCGASEINFPEMTDAKTNNIKNIDKLFYNCKNLSTITNILVNKESASDSALSSAPHVYFDGVESLNNLFYGCAKFKNIRLCISLSGCIRVESLISNCTNLNTVDLSGSDFSSITEMIYFILNCGELSTVKINDASFQSFTGNSVEGKVPSFEKCYNLTHLEMKDTDLSSVTDASFIGRRSLTYLDLSGAVMTSYTNVNKLFSYTNNDFSLEYVNLTGTQFGQNYSANQMFSKCKNIQTVEGFKAPADCSQMFKGCNNTERIVLANWNTEAAVNMNEMFSGCTKLETVTFSTDTSKQCGPSESAVNIFSGCVNIKRVEGFKAPTDCSQMFKGCNNTERIVLANWNTEAAVNMNEMFSGCTKLETVTFSTDTSKQCGPSESAANIFSGCINIKRVEGFKAPTDCSQMFKGCNNTERIVLANWNTEAAVNMNEMFSGCTKLETVTFSTDTSKQCGPSESAVNIFSGCVNIKRVEGFKAPTDCSQMFKGCNNTESIVLANWNTEAAVNMNEMFSGCTALKSFDLNGIDTTKVKTMDSMFSGCTKLETVTFSTDTSKQCGPSESAANIFSGCINIKRVEGFKAPANCSEMFKGCYQTEGIELANWNTENVNDMSSMFYGCNNLKTIDLSSFKTSNVTNMKAMFQNCYFLCFDSSTWTNWDTSHVTDMSYMFKDCCYNFAKTIDSDLLAAYFYINISNFSFASVTDTSNMFTCGTVKNVDHKYDILDKIVLPMGDKGKAPNLVNAMYMFMWRYNTGEIENLEYFETSSNLKKARSIFSRTGVTMLDIRGMDFSSLDNSIDGSGYIFDNCEFLITVYADPSKNYIPAKGDGMFSNDKKIKGGAGTLYLDANKKYAIIDGGTSNRGYFTDYHTRTA